jgi:hypothetical protein
MTLDRNADSVFPQAPINRYICSGADARVSE